MAHRARKNSIFGASVAGVLTLLLTGSLSRSNPEPALQEAGSLKKENLAEGKLATASSSQDEGKSADAGVDGDPGTRWCASDGSAPQWLQVDLGRPESLTGCRVAWEMAEATYGFKVEGSTDGNRWKLLVDVPRSGPVKFGPGLADAPAPGPEGWRGGQLIAFKADQIRQVRLTMSDLQEGCWASLYELEVFGTKPASPKIPKKPVADRDRILAEVKLPEGFEAKVFAAPPDVQYPTCLAASPSGEVYVGIDENGSLDAKPKRGRVVRCVDSDGDGRADRFTTFAEMDSPRGVVWDRDTLYVLHPPQLSAYQDRDGDGVAESHRSIVDGIGFGLKYRGADHTTNGIRLGIDGFLYIAVGDYGFVQARGTDGPALQMLGGGVVRVRPDGTGLEIISRGQRNIYDVAISPTMDLFTRDNTNDGDGWDVRLSHVIPLGNYGYPSLFKRFGDEIIQPLADYGGGSPCGSLYLQEPGWPEGFADALYTCEWGRGGVFRHPLSPNGASFRAGQEAFITMPRPTDVDVDASGRMYISSWKDGGFTYSKPAVGYVISVVPKGLETGNRRHDRPVSIDLVADLGSASATIRLAAQRALVADQATDASRVLIEKLISNASKPVEVRAAAVFTLGQWPDAAADAILADLSGRPSPLREFAVQAIGDRKAPPTPSMVSGVLSALGDDDPRVRLSAVVAASRLKLNQSANSLVNRLIDADPIVRHAATRGLAGLEAVNACLAGLVVPATANGCAQSLSSMHVPSAVDGLKAVAGDMDGGPGKMPAIRALCRLYFDEAPYVEGAWWGTRPDTTGPYYKPTTWDRSSEIAETLRSIVDRADDRTAREILREVVKDRIDLEGLTDRAMTLSADDVTLRAGVIAMLAGRQNLSTKAWTFLSGRASTDPILANRVAALRALIKHDNQVDARKAAEITLGRIATEPRVPQEFINPWSDYVNQARHRRDVPAFVAMTEAADPGASVLGFAVLLSATSSGKAPEDAQRLAAKTVDEALKGDKSARVLKAISLGRVKGYEAIVRELGRSARTEVRDAAVDAAGRLGLSLDPPRSSEAPGKKMISAQPYEQVLAEAVADKGDATLGERLFERQGCINCHAVSKSGPLKGPYLGDVASRYNRPELVESILKPSARIAQGFETQKIATGNGQTLEGFVVREAGEEIELRNSTGSTIVVDKKDVEERVKGELSVMPVGLLDPLTAHDLASILAYFESLKGKM